MRALPTIRSRLISFQPERTQAALMRPSWVSAATPSSRPISSTILPSITFSTVVPVKCILRPVAAGRAPIEEIVEGRAGVRAAAFPLADDVVALGDQVRRAPEIEIGERGPEVGHEGLDVFAAAARLMQRVFQQHVRRGDLIDDRQIDVLAPEVGEPAADDGLVVFLFAHWSAPHDFAW